MPQSIAKSHVHCVPSCLFVGFLLLILIGCDHTCGHQEAPGTAAKGTPAESKPEAVANPDDGRNEAEPQVARQTKVSIDNFTFAPATLEIRAGTRVVWVNGDDVPHTVRSTDGLFRSEALDTDDRFEHLFSRPGVYEYYCGVHTHMTGKVIVK